MAGRETIQGPRADPTHCPPTITVYVDRVAGLLCADGDCAFDRKLQCARPYREGTKSAESTCRLVNQPMGSQGFRREAQTRLTIVKSGKILSLVGQHACLFRDYKIDDCRYRGNDHLPRYRTRLFSNQASSSSFFILPPLNAHRTWP